MRTNRNKDFNNPPLSLKNAKAEMNRIAINKDNAAISDKIYKGDKVLITDNQDPYYNTEDFEVRYELRKLYYNKCAYCESIEFDPDVEHFRPKNKVTGIKNNNGYYWLCYEWSNLIPACTKCNSGKGKWNKFPVLGLQITEPPLKNGNLDFEKCKADSDVLKNEISGLIHPEVEEPEKHLKVDINGVLASNQGDNSKGYHTIDVCDLNRGNLRKARKEIIDNIINRFYSIFEDFRANGITSNYLPIKIEKELILILENSDPKEKYSFVPFYILSKFQHFVNESLQKLDDIEKQTLISQYKAFINN